MRNVTKPSWLFPNLWLRHGRIGNAKGMPWSLATIWFSKTCPKDSMLTTPLKGKGANRCPGWPLWSAPHPSTSPCMMPSDNRWADPPTPVMTVRALPMTSAATLNPRRIRRYASRGDIRRIICFPIFPKAFPFGIWSEDWIPSIPRNSGETNRTMGIRFTCGSGSDGTGCPA